MIEALFALALASQDPETDCTAAVFEPDTRSCGGPAFLEAEAALDEYYATRPHTIREHAWASQNAWRQFREQECSSEANPFLDGELLPTPYFECKTRLTKERLLQLQARYGDRERVEPLTIGAQHMLKALGEWREINVVLPLSYEDSPERRYPTVYFLDGGIAQDFMMQVGVSRWTQMWGRTGEFIIVGIETKDRQRELLPPTTDKEALEVWPTAGESGVFMEWIRADVMPLIEANYRTDGKDYLVGESAAGHFVVETMQAESELFDGYAAISPSLWWEDQLLARRAEQGMTGSEQPLFISIANEGETMDEGVRAVVKWRQDNGAAATCFVDRPDLTHGNSYHALLPSALQFLLPGEEPLPEEWGMVTGCAQ